MQKISSSNLDNLRLYLAMDIELMKSSSDSFTSFQLFFVGLAFPDKRDKIKKIMSCRA
jgi:hypothetical protein